MDLLCEMLNTCDKIDGRTLDHALSRGCFRVRNFFISDDVAIMREGITEVFWLRTDLHQLPPNGTHKLFKRNKDITLNLTETAITPEAEALFARYRASLDFEHYSSLSAYFDQTTPESKFNECCLELRLNGQLVGCGYFNTGDTSVMGILNMYEPALKKRSLGKYLMLQKMYLMKERGYRWFYPGYIGLDSTQMDYKILPDASCTEVYVKGETNRWIPFPPEGKKGLYQYSQFYDEVPEWAK